MLVNSVTSSASFGHQYRPTLEDIANLSDKDVRHIAYQKAGEQVNDKKHRRIDKAIIYSIPVVAGLAEAVKPVSTEALKFAGKNVSRLARLKNFGATALGWAGAFLAIDAVFAGKRVLDKYSPKMKEFSNNHPGLTIFGTIGAAVAAMFGLQKGGVKLAKVLTAKIPAEKYTKGLTKLAKALNESKIINNTAKLVRKAPSSLKAAGATALMMAPLALIFASIAHSIGHEKAKAKVANQNYEVLKGVQELAQLELEAEAKG